MPQLPALAKRFLNKSLADTSASISNDELCDRCRNIALALDLNSWSSVLKSAWKHPSDYGIVEKASLQSDHCGLCSIFMAAFERRERRHSREQEEEVEEPGPMPYALHRTTGFELRIGACEHILIPSEAPSKWKKTASSEIMTLGRIINPDSVEFSLANDWLENCRSKHTTTCVAQQRILHSSIQGFKTVNCNTRQIDPHPPDEPYIALSYLWGSTSSEAETLLPFTLPDTCPTTIKDAILVALKLSIPYIWIDRYCIDQSNPEDKHNIISQMDKVYEEAEVTIIAAAGRDPWYGLPGISGRKEGDRQMRSVTIGNRIFVAVENPSLERRSGFAHGGWWTRGWTYQEMLLPRRRLVFTEKQLYWQCSGQFCMEALNVPDSLSKEMGSLFEEMTPFPKLGLGVETGHVYERLKEYYVRNLSYDSDVLNAFAGVFNRMGRVRDLEGDRLLRDFWGIPVITKKNKNNKGKGKILNQKNSGDGGFAKGLSWYTSNRKRVTRREGEWPSWSWTSVKSGGLDFECRYRIFLYQDNISVRITHQDGTTMDTVGYAARAKDYTAFHPWIDITSWTSTAFSSTEIPQFTSSKKRNSVFLDTVNAIAIQSSITAIYLGITALEDLNIKNGMTRNAASARPYLVFLLVRDVGEGEFKRVGIWEYWLGLETWPELSVQDLPVGWLPDLERIVGGEGRRWERRTLRLV